MTIRNVLLSLAIGLLVAVRTVQADLVIEITKGNDTATPIAVVPFAWRGEGAISQDVAKIIADNLERSGLFAPLSRENMLSLPSSHSEVYYRDWRLLDMAFLLVGSIERVKPNGPYQIQYELFDVIKQERLLGERIRSSAKELRARAHYISDRVFKKLTGTRGAFATRIVYVTTDRKSVDNTTYRLWMADADGRRAQVMLTSKQPILSPAWSPDGKRIAYVSFESGRPGIYIQELATGKRTRVTHYRGLNGAPAWSPDGRKLAMVLSRDGNPEIYVMDLQSQSLQRITRHYAIDTEPAWSPDGRHLVFTSNRGGGPQIYRVALASGDVSRVTFEGNYNARARYSPDGRNLIMVHRNRQQFHIAVQDLETERLRILTETQFDESPSIAPNGSMLIYATQQGTQGVLGAVSFDGNVKFRLPSRLGDVREPAWSPFLN